MSTTARRAQILQEMQNITRMERGKLCVQSRGPGSPTFYKLPAWHKGQNATRYVPADEVPALKEALANHQRFQDLAAEFAELTITQTRLDARADSKKKPKPWQASRTSGSAKPTSS
jgi:hypothetical protein